MKNLWTLILLLFVFTFTGCDQNDDAQTTPQTPTDGYTLQGTFYQTPNCYIEFDNTNQDKIKLFFLNGRMLNNVTNAIPNTTFEYLFSVNTTNWVFLNIKASQNPSIASPQYPNIQTGVQYVGGPRWSEVVHNGTIESLSTPYFVNNVEYGQDQEEFPPNYPNFSLHKVGTTGPFITFNSYNYDANNQTATVNIDYTFIAGSGDTITGHYEGTIGVFVN